MEWLGAKMGGRAARPQLACVWQAAHPACTLSFGLHLHCMHCSQPSHAPPLPPPATPSTPFQPFSNPPDSPAPTFESRPTDMQPPPGVSWKKTKSKTKSKRKGDDARLDYYALLGLQHERFMANESQIRNGGLISGPVAGACEGERVQSMSREDLGQGRGSAEGKALT